jgi:hypothetical protein
MKTIKEQEQILRELVFHFENLKQELWPSDPSKVIGSTSDFIGRFQVELLQKVNELGWIKNESK